MLYASTNAEALSYAGVRPAAVDEARLLKPAVPRIGDHGIPIRDEIDLCRNALLRCSSNVARRCGPPKADRVGTAANEDGVGFAPPLILAGWKTFEMLYRVVKLYPRMFRLLENRHYRRRIGRVGK